MVADCWLAAENLMLSACALGLGTCCIGSAIPALNSPEAKSELGISADVELSRRLSSVRRADRRLKSREGAAGPVLEVSQRKLQALPPPHPPSMI